MSATELLPRWYDRVARGLDRVDDSWRGHRERWVLILTLGTWLPLATLAALGGVAEFSADFEPLVTDLAVHARLLAAVPLLSTAVVQFDKTTRTISALGFERITAGEDLKRLERSAAGLERARRSLLGFAVMLALAGATGVLHARLALDGPRTTWLAPPGHEWLSAAGLWYCAVCIPVFAFLLLRVAWRWVLWSSLLFRLSRLRLRLVPSHGDNAAGLGPVGLMPLQLSPAVAAVSLVAGMAWLKRLVYEGVPATAFIKPAAGLLGLMLALFFLPSLVFIGQLTRIKVQALHDFGWLIHRVNDAFERRWLPPESDVNVFLQTSASSPVADLGTVYSQIEKMSVIPFRKGSFLAVTAAVLVPLSPLVLSQVPLRELVQIVAKDLF